MLYGVHLAMGGIRIHHFIPEFGVNEVLFLNINCLVNLNGVVRFQSKVFVKILLPGMLDVNILCNRVLQKPDLLNSMIYFL